MIKVGVVGVGHLGRHHARVFSGIKNCKLIGVYDNQPERAQEVASEYGTKAFPTYQGLLEQVDAVDVAATTTFHYELAKLALQQGKHVFIEKPITSTKEQADELLQLAKQHNKQIQVGHIERFNPVILQVASKIKDPMFVESHRLAPFTHRGSDVPVVLDLMIHDIDLIMSFINCPIKEIRASGVGIITKSIDIATARLEFENGAIANVTASRISLKRERKIRFFQKEAYITVDFQNKRSTVMKKSAKLILLLPQILAGKTDFDPAEMVDQKEIVAPEGGKDALTHELEAFVQAITKNTRPICNGEDGARALNVALQIMEIIERNA